MDRRTELEAYRRQQVANKLNISLRKTDELIISGEIKSFKLGKVRLVSAESLAAFIRKQEAAAK